MRKPRPKDSVFLDSLLLERAILATGAPQGTGTHILVAHTPCAASRGPTPSQPFHSETRIGSHQSPDQVPSRLPLPPEPCPNPLASSPSRTGTRGTLVSPPSLHSSHSQTSPCPSARVLAHLQASLPPASLPGTPFPAPFTAKWPLTRPEGVAQRLPPGQSSQAAGSPGAEATGLCASSSRRSALPSPV